jgi:hypothetical protein
MGMLGPVVCYQVPRGIETKDEKDLEDIKLIASKIDEKTPTIKRIWYDDEYVGSRTVFRDHSGFIRVFRETSILDRRTFAGISRAVGAKNFSLLVADVNVLLDCDPFVAAALLTMNRKWGLQVFAIKVDGLRTLSGEAIGRTRGVEDLLFENSEMTQKILSKKITKLRDEFPEIESAMALGYQVDSDDVWLRLLEHSQRSGAPGEDRILEGIRERSTLDPLFERKR